MDVKRVVLYDCRIDGEFKEVSKNVFHCIVKTKFDGVDGAPSIVLLEVTKAHLAYLETYDYKDSEIAYFDIKGSFEVRKNKKDIPFLLLKATSVKLSSKRVADNRRNLEKKRAKIKEEKAKKKLENNSYDFSYWYKKIEFLGLEKKVLDSYKIKLIDEEHLNPTNVEFNKNYILNTNLVAVVEPIENSDEYKLILGWKPLLASKLFDKKITCYITNKTKEELSNEFANIELDNELDLKKE